MSRRVAASLRGCDAPSPSPRPKPPALICGIMRGTSGAARIQGEPNSGSANVVHTGRSVCCLRADSFFAGCAGASQQGHKIRAGKQARVRDIVVFVDEAAVGRRLEPREGRSRAARGERESRCLRGFPRHEAPGLHCISGSFDHQDHRLLRRWVFIHFKNLRVQNMQNV